MKLISVLFDVQISRRLEELSSKYENLHRKRGLSTLSRGKHKEQLEMHGSSLRKQADGQENGEVIQYEEATHHRKRRLRRTYSHIKIDELHDLDGEVIQSDGGFSQTPDSELRGRYSTS